MVIFIEKKFLLYTGKYSKCKNKKLKKSQEKRQKN